MCHICSATDTVLPTSTLAGQTPSRIGIPLLSSPRTGGSRSPSPQERSGCSRSVCWGTSRCADLIPPKRGQWCLRTHRHAGKTVVYFPAARLSQPADRKSPRLLAQAEQSTAFSLSHTLRSPLLSFPPFDSLAVLPSFLLKFNGRNHMDPSMTMLSALHEVPLHHPLLSVIHLPASTCLLQKQLFG